MISIEEENGEKRKLERNGKRRLRLDCGYGESEERRKPLPKTRWSDEIAGR